MAIPKYHQIFLPILKVLKDGKEIKTSTLPELILDQGYVKLTDEEKVERLNTGGNVFHNRVYWATSYLTRGNYTERPSRGMIRITQKGVVFVNSNPSEFTLQMLKDDKDYQDYIPTRLKDNIQSDDHLKDMTPEDLMNKGFDELNDTLKNDLLDKLYSINPYHFESVVLELFKKMGYGNFEETTKSRDGGIDGIINQDQLGIEKIYIQAKRYADGNHVREPEIRNFIGAMSGDVSKGIFVTTSLFDASAVRKAKDARNHKIILIDGNLLVSLMIKYNIGVQIKSMYELKEIDEDFFELG